MHSENTENLNQTLKVKKNDVIDFMNDNNEHCIVRIIGPAGKSTGKYKTCKNIKYEAPEVLTGTKPWIDISALRSLSVNQPIPPNEQSELDIENNSLATEEIFETQSNDFTSAKEKELQSLTKIKFTKLFHIKINNAGRLDGYVQ